MPAVYYSFLTPFLVASSLFVDSLLDYHISLANGTLFSASDNGTIASCPVVAEHFTVVGGIIPMIAAAAACCGGWLISSLQQQRSCILSWQQECERSSLREHGAAAFPPVQQQLQLLLSFLPASGRQFFHYSCLPASRQACCCAAGSLFFPLSFSVARTELVFPLSSPVPLCFASNSALSLPLHQGLVVFMSSYIAKGPISLLEVMGCLSHCHNLYHVHQSNALFLVYMLLVFLLAFHMVQE